MSLIGSPISRVDGHDKVIGTARYAFEHQRPELLYAWIVPATIAAGRVVRIGRREALEMPGVVEVVTSDNCLPLNDPGDTEVAVLQSDRVAYRGQVVALVVADSPEHAREAAERMDIEYELDAADLAFRSDHPDAYAPAHTNAFFATDSIVGDAERMLSRSDFTIDAVYETPAAFNSPMEPHATLAEWHGDHLDLIDSLQGTNWARDTLAAAFGIEPDKIRIRAPHVGGGFGSKGPVRVNSVLAAMAAKMTGRPVKISLTRQMMFGLTGYRSPTRSHVRLGADADGRLTAISHEAFGLGSRIQEFVEQTAVATRHMYAAPNRRTTHRVVSLHVPTPSFMRAPGETPGLFALESAMDELAELSGVDPIELRVRNEPTQDPEEGHPFSGRHLVECLQRGAEAFDWSSRDPRPGVRRDGRWLVGTGVASAVYPADTWVSSAAVTARADGHFVVELNATDIGTGARTVLAQVAASELGVGLDHVSLKIADTDLPAAPVAGGSFGTSSWSWAIVKACGILLERLASRGSGPLPHDGIRVVTDTAADIAARPARSRFSFGAQFAEARVDLDSGEISVPRMLGVFAAGKILNPRTARSQLIGGMTMGLSMALHEHAAIDHRFGGYGARDFAGYHIASNADVMRMDVECLEYPDFDINPLGGKGVGEIGMVGAAAAIANAVWHATGVRVRSLPIRPDDLIARLPLR